MPVSLLKVYEVEASTNVSGAPPNQSFTVTASANSGDWVTGGGFKLATNDLGIQVLESHPVMSGGVATGWVVSGINQGSNSNVVTAYALCAGVDT
jgi:hypothetical protein